MLKNYLRLFTLLFTVVILWPVQSLANELKAIEITPSLNYQSGGEEIALPAQDSVLFEYNTAAALSGSDTALKPLLTAAGQLWLIIVITLFILIGLAIFFFRKKDLPQHILNYIKLAWIRLALGHKILLTTASVTIIIIASLALILQLSGEEVSTQSTQHDPQDKGLLWMGHNRPTWAMLEDSNNALDQKGFNGLIWQFDIFRDSSTEPFNSFHYDAFSRKQLNYANFVPVINRFNNAHLKGLKHNYLRVNSSSTHRLVDEALPPHAQFTWFEDDVWTTITENMRIAARVAKNTNMEGIVLDFEPYHRHMFGYIKMTQGMANPPSEEAYRQQIFERGRQIGAVISAEYPDIKLLFFMAYAARVTEDRAVVNGKITDANRNYTFAPDFVDGMIDAAGPNVEFVDATEHAYASLQRSHLVTRFDDIRNTGRQVTRFPQKYDRQVKVGFGLWLDKTNTNPWKTDPADFSQNFYTPDRWELIVREALRLSEGYVWIFTTNVLNVWTGANYPIEYHDALINSRNNIAGNNPPQLTSLPNSITLQPGQRQVVDLSVIQDPVTGSIPDSAVVTLLQAPPFVTHQRLDKALVIAPPQEASGSYSIVIRASDGVASDTKTITLNIQRPSQPTPQPTPTPSKTGHSSVYSPSTGIPTIKPIVSVRPPAPTSVQPSSSKTAALKCRLDRILYRINDLVGLLCTIDSATSKLENARLIIPTDLGDGFYLKSADHDQVEVSEYVQYELGDLEPNQLLNYHYQLTLMRQN